MSQNQPVANNFADLESVVGPRPTSPTEVSVVVDSPHQPPSASAPAALKPPAKRVHVIATQRPSQRPMHEVQPVQLSSVSLSFSEFFDTEVSNARIVDRIHENRHGGRGTSVNVDLFFENELIGGVEFALAVLPADRVQMRAVHAVGCGVVFRKGLILFRDEVIGDREVPIERENDTHKLHGLAEFVSAVNVDRRQSRQVGGR